MACIATAYIVMATKTRGGRDEEQRRKHKRPEVERERKERHLQLLPQRERFLVSRHVQVHTVLADGGEERGVTQALRRDPEVRDRNVEPADANIVGGWKSGACERTVRCVAVRCGAVPCGAIVSLHPSQILYVPWQSHRASINRNKRPAPAVKEESPPATRAALETPASPVARVRMLSNSPSTSPQKSTYMPRNWSSERLSPSTDAPNSEPAPSKTKGLNFISSALKLLLRRSCGSLYSNARLSHASKE